jgi:hypothetical protein
MKTAVQWLQIKMATASSEEMVENINVWFKQAKEMEKEQKIEFACDVYDLNYGKDKSFRRAAEDYYNEIIK